MLTNRAKIRLLVVGGTEPTVLLKIMRKTKWGTGASDSVQKKLEEKTDFIAVQKKDYWSLVPITRQTLVESTKEPHTHGIQNRKPTLETGSIARWRRDLCWKHSREQNPVEFAVLVRQLKEKNMPKEYFEQIVLVLNQSIVSISLKLQIIDLWVCLHSLSFSISMPFPD